MSCVELAGSFKSRSPVVLLPACCHPGYLSLVTLSCSSSNMYTHRLTKGVDVSLVSSCHVGGGGVVDTQACSDLKVKPVVFSPPFPAE